MLAFQLFVDLFCLYAFTRVIKRIKAGALTTGWGIFWLVFWFGAGVAVSLPWTTSMLATRLGVTRGVDLVMYVSVIGLFYIAFKLMVKIEKLEQTITKLTREVAFKDLSKQ